MRKILATGLAMGIIALGSIAAPSSASALAPGQSVKKCNSWIQHSNSAVYWRTCYLIVQKTRAAGDAHSLLEVKNVGARSRVIDARTSYNMTRVTPKPGSWPFPSFTRCDLMTLPAGKTKTLVLTYPFTAQHATFSFTSTVTVKGWAAGMSPRTPIIYRF